MFSRAHGREDLTFAEALRAEQSRLRERPARSPSPHAYAWRGRYAELCEPYLRAFPASQLHFMLYEDLTEDPVQALRPVFEFLGVDPAEAPAPAAERVNATEDPTPSIPREVLEDLARSFREPNRRLEHILGRELAHWDRPSENALAFALG